MTEGRNNYEADRFAHGTGQEADGREDEDLMPGTEGTGTVYLPETGRAEAGAGSDRAEGTIGAVGEMDFTGAPAGPGGASGPSGGSGAGRSQGGGPGGGSTATGGAGPKAKDEG